MLSIHPEIAKANKAVLTDYQNSVARLKAIAESLATVKDVIALNDSKCNEVTDEHVDKSIAHYFKVNVDYLLMVIEHGEVIRDEAYYTSNDFETLKVNNRRLYEDILPDHYTISYVNPSYAVKVFGKELGQLLSGVAYTFRESVGYIYEERLDEQYHSNQLLIELYEVMVLGGVKEVGNLKVIIRDRLIEGLEVMAYHNRLRYFSPEFKTYSHIAKECDLHDLRYLFRYGMYIDDNEIDSAKFLLSLEEEEIQLIADTYTESYYRGFKRQGIDLTSKKSTMVTYHVGWERIIRKAYENFAVRGIEPTVYYDLRGVQRPRLYNTKPNKQMEYDHRYSNRIFFDEVYVEKRKVAEVKALAKLQKEAKAFAGLALIEVFGEKPFEPVNSDANMIYDETTTALKTDCDRFLQQEFRKYVKGDDYSFTIHAYPLPSIGKDYEAIFKEVIKVNTLDSDLYEVVQQKMIDALDQADYVKITGRNGNETNLTVGLQPLNKPKEETKFNNCTADVNVPVGEIFTTPRLAGTNGLLHVKEIYLTGLKYLDLKIWFDNGMISKYDCNNFNTEEENKNFVRETLMHPHTTLPLGEFAIGTNTVAYMMAKRYDINSVLPILIGEKTGPHFAIGDTCYNWAEDHAVYNSDGKEIVVKDNAVSILRKTDIEKAYMYKHTDITIPYNELDCITGYDRNNGEYRIIENGRFVLEGTELLNEPFKE